jgi:hypothetical protein
MALTKAKKALLNETFVETSGNQTIAGVKTFTSLPVVPFPSIVKVGTANGYGSINTRIRRFSVTLINSGTDITYADSATLGASFTINTSGIYSLYYADNFNTPQYAGISTNSGQLTSSIASISAASILAIGLGSNTTNSGTSCAVTTYLSAGDVLRPHTDTAAAIGSGPNIVQFSIVRIA